ncbi:MAG: hypothetical protein K940chlam7_01933, partial [Chlamydiae bacterium]|nr:hypothetical protein [Chlamydiota bacterium]
TKQGELSFHTESGEITIFPNEKALNHWLADEAAVDIWEIEDLREGKSDTFYKLQRADEGGYDTFETKENLFDQLREDYGVLWKLKDLENHQTTYIRFKTGLFGSSYDHVAHENLIYVANSLEFGAPNRTTSATSDRASWGKSIAACVLGGLLISAGRSWGSNQNSVSDAIATMKGTLGPAAFKTAFVFQMSAIAAMSRQQGGTLPGALLAGMMLLPEPVKGQPLCPQLAGSYDTPHRAWDVALSGNYAYVADRFSGLQIIDVSNVTNPTLASSYDTPGDARDVALSGNYAYIADYTSGLQIIDVSNAANPTFAGSYDTPGTAYGVAVSGNYAYVAATTSGLQIIDVSNVANPTLAGSYDTPGNAEGVAVSGNYAYVADQFSGLQIIDVSNVANPTLAGSYNTPGDAYGVAVSASYAYVSGGGAGLQIIDISNVANPTVAGSYDTPSTAYDVAVSGNYAYVADDYSGLQIIDVANVANPTLAGSYNTPDQARGVAVSGNYAYVEDDSGGGLQIIKIPCPTSSSSSSTASTSSSTTRSSTSSSTTRSSTSSSTTRSSTSSSTPRSSTSLLASTLKSTSAIISLSTDSTTTRTPIFISTAGISSPDTPSFLWIVGLAAGGVLCLGLTGGTALILRRRRGSSNNAPSFIEQGSKAHDSFRLEPTVRRAHKEIGGAYYQLNKISKEEAREVYEQTGHLIVFPEGEKKFKYVLGRGNFGAIKVAQRIEDREYVASKKVKGEENIRASEEEADMQKEAVGENVLPIYNTIRLEETLYHFMPLAGFGNGREVQSHLSALHNPMLATEILKFVIRDILTGLKTIHAKGIYHLDIKPENIVFTKDGTAYITDFGCAKKAERGRAQMSWETIGDNRYFSPERLQASREGSYYDAEKADVWAAGMTALQMIKDMSPLELFEMPRDFTKRVHVCTQEYFQEKLQRLQQLQKPEERDIWYMIQGLLDPNPKTRLTAEKALAAPCFGGLKKETQAHVF